MIYMQLNLTMSERRSVSLSFKTCDGFLPSDNSDSDIVRNNCHRLQAQQGALWHHCWNFSCLRSKQAPLKAGNCPAHCQVTHKFNTVSTLKCTVLII